MAVLISLSDKSPEIYKPDAEEVKNRIKTTKQVKIAWAMLCIVMVVLYIIFG